MSEPPEGQALKQLPVIILIKSGDLVQHVCEMDLGIFNVVYNVN